MKFNFKYLVNTCLCWLATASMIWALPLLVQQAGLPAYLTFTSVTATAQEEQQRKKRQTRRVPTIKPSTNKVIDQARMMIDPDTIPWEEGEPKPEPIGTPEEGIELLMELIERKGINSYEKASILNILAYAYFVINDLEASIDAYEGILRESITEALELSTLRILIQLYMAEGQFDKSLEYIDRWSEISVAPDPSVTFIKANNYYFKRDYQEALKQALLVEEQANAAGRPMRENWWNMQLVLYNEFENIDEVIRILEILIDKYPKKRYWMQLAGMYGEKDWEDKALSAYYISYAHGFMDKEGELVMLAQRLINHEQSPNPYEAAQVIEKGLADGIVEENEKNMKLLARAYSEAQEHNKAIDTWRKAAKYTDDGEIDFRLGYSLADEDRHEEAVEALREAIKKGDLKYEADAYIRLGRSLMELKEWENAKDAFRKVGDLDEDRAVIAVKFIKYISSEQVRLQKIQELLDS